jgi:hypothetical protein
MPKAARKTLKISGKRFKLSTSHRLKRDAKKAAGGRRDKGARARVVERDGKWQVFTHGGR